MVWCHEELAPASGASTAHTPLRRASGASAIFTWFPLQRLGTVPRRLVGGGVGDRSLGLPLAACLRGAHQLACSLLSCASPSPTPWQVSRGNHMASHWLAFAGSWYIASLVQVEFESKLAASGCGPGGGNRLIRGSGPAQSSMIAGCPVHLLSPDGIASQHGIRRHSE